MHRQLIVLRRIKSTLALLRVYLTYAKIKKVLKNQIARK